MLDAAPDAMIGVDTDGVIVMVNVQTETVFGYPREDLLGQPIELLVPERAKKVHPAHRGKYFSEPRTRPMGLGLDLAGRRVDGTEFPAEISLSSIQTDSGPVAIAAVRDVTDRKKTEATFQAMLDAAPDAMVGVSRDGTIVMANVQTEAVFGYRRGELIGQPVEILVPDRAKEVHPANRESYFGAPRTRPMGVGLDLAGRRADGTEFPAEISLSSMEAAEGTIALAAIRDITDRKMAEEETRRARHEADRANHAKSEFLSRVSHELRTPLNSILGFAQLLEMDEITAVQRKSVKQIRGGGQHLLGLIDEILDIEKIASGKMRLSLEPVHVGEVVREVLQLVMPMAEGDRVRLVAPADDELDVSVQADRQRLKQVLLNLLSNALKFNHVGGEVRISTQETSASSFQLSVSDTGIGIAEDLMPDLFTPFDRLGADRRGIEGTGLGLALSKSLIEAMNGTIGATSVPEEGSTFRIALPFAEQIGITVDGGHDEVRARPEAVLERTILYVEDNLANLQLIQGMLDYRPSIRLLSAMQGSIALELSMQHRPDLILLDLHLPDISGEEVLEQLRSDVRTRDIPVVIVSADASRDTIKRLESAGVRSYVTKPIDVEVLLRMLDDILG
jgi:protein-histidine pros-kinase